MLKKVLVVIAFINVSLGVAQDNVFLKRDFWKTAPSIATVDEKIKEGNNPSQANTNNFDGVVYAILENAPLETIKHLMSQKGNDINKLTHDGRTYVFWAAYAGNTHLMKYLLGNGAKTDILDDHGNTILNFAASTGQQNTEVYDLCLAHGADLKKDLNPSGANALLLAAPNDKDFNLIPYFESKGLNLESKDAEGNGVFNYVARTGNIDLMNKFLSKGIKGNDQAFLFAAYGTRGNTNGLEVYKYLESQGLSPKTANKEGVTPLHILASRSHDQEVLSYMLDKGLDVNQPDHQGNTPFLNACSRNSLEVIQLLAPKVKDINLANKKGETALFLATQDNKTEVVHYLIEKGANEQVIDAEGHNLTYALVQSYSPKDQAQFQDKLELLKLKGLKLDQPQKNGDTWYHLAANKGSMELMEMASKMNQDINAKNQEGNTALHLAAMKAQDDQLLKYLLNVGAKKSEVTDFDETAYDLAQENELLKQNHVSIEFLK